MKYLVLGSSGVIGSALVSLLKKENETVLEFDIQRDVNEDLRLENNVLLEEKMKEADFVYFLAFDVGGYKYLSEKQDDFEYITNNIKIMSNTFEMIKKYKKPFVFASTQLVELKNSSYGILKKIGERYTYSLGGLVVKLWNVYGMEKESAKSHVISDLIHKAINSKKINLISNGKEERQFISAEECSRCLYILANKYNDIDRSFDYHITSFIWTKISDLAKEISDICGNVPIFFGDADGCIKYEPNDIIKQYWIPKITLSEDLKRFVNDYKGLL